MVTKVILGHFGQGKRGYYYCRKSGKDVLPMNHPSLLKTGKGPTTRIESNLATLLMAQAEVSGLEI